MLPIPERVRTLAATADVAKLSVDGAPSPARGGVDERGRPVLLVHPGESLHGLRADAVVAVNLTAMRQLGAATHPRGLIEVQGWAEAVPEAEARSAAVAVAAHLADESLFDALERFGHPHAPRLLRLDVGQVVYLTGQESGVLDADDYLGAAPDPLTETAERVLAHVNSSHRAQLAAGVARQLGEPAGDVWLWELDRYGATVRVDESLVRFPWPTPARSELCLETALRGLLCTC
ncbi:DUF2470 domain-containing protein [[Actinomadura] parvosata subsp. kistnae]|uniref:DUF2470 domain-containing protein n=2 Tax=Nonomuraea TaxID=83681 RepID=A0A1V0AKC8_9ACTN|nr:DUF2470 domain-containing protein [Nonomuraea sp. ATCC 55076]